MSHKQVISQNEDEEFYHMKPAPHQDTCYQGLLSCCGSLSGCLKIWCPCVCCCCDSPLYQLQTSKLGVLQTFGRFSKVIKPGFHVINPWTDSIIQIDMKTNIMTLQPQKIITKDTVTLQIETVVYYRTVDPYKLVYKLGTNLHEIRTFIAEMSYNALRTVAGQHTFQQFLQNRAKLADALQDVVAPQVHGWGLYIENIFIKDLILGQQTKRNLQSAAIQKRVSQANIISAKADVQAAKMLKQTAQILNSSSAMQIRYLEMVQNIVVSGGQKSMFVNLKGKQ